MESITQHYIVDLSSNNNFVQVPAVEGDGHSVRYIEAELIQNGQPYFDDLDPTKVYVTIMGTKPDGTEVWNTGEVTQEGYVKFELTYQMMAVPGRGVYQVALFSRETNTQLKSFPFYVIVTKSAVKASEILSSNEFQVLADLIEGVEHLAEGVEEDAERAETAANNAEASKVNAKTSEDNAKLSEDKAKISETNAANYAAAASTSEQNAQSSAELSTQKANEASASATSAQSSASIATQKANDASVSETSASNSASIAVQNANNAASSASDASNSALIATQKASEASASATSANQYSESANDSAVNAANSAVLSESYAIGGTGTREGENYDNSKYYKEQCEQIAEGLGGTLIPMGTIHFADLDHVLKNAGYMYNIIDEFTTTSEFKEGSGVAIPAGSNVYRTADNYWDVLAGSPVTGVKGNAEQSFRKGNINITKANIGLDNAVNIVISTAEPSQAENDYWLEDY